MTETPTAAACADCGLHCDDPGYADFVAADDVWKSVSPTGDEGGILCANCMVYRAAARSIKAGGRFTSGPFAESDWRKPASK